MRMNTDPDRKILSKRFSREIWVIWGSPCSHRFAPKYIAGVLKEVYFCRCINESKKSEIKNQCWIVPRNRTIIYLPVIRFSSNFWIPSLMCNRDFHYHSVLTRATLRETKQSFDAFCAHIECVLLWLQNLDYKTPISKALSLEEKIFRQKAPLLRTF